MEIVFLEGVLALLVMCQIRCCPAAMKRDRAVGKRSQLKNAVYNNYVAFKGTKLPLLYSGSERNLKQSIFFYVELLQCMKIIEIKSKWEILDTHENGI